MCPFCFYFCMQIMLKTDMEDKKSLCWGLGGGGTSQDLAGLCQSGFIGVRIGLL